MADTVDLNKIKEFFDAPEALDQKVLQVAQLITGANHGIFFTGAGISTAAKIPDFRGPNGVWTAQAQGRAAPKCISLVDAAPTKTHQWIESMTATPAKQGQLYMASTCKLYRSPFQYVVSQNVDGLHRRSGLEAQSISELHGNCFISVCWHCGADYPSEKEVHGGLNPPKTCKECHPRTPHFCHCTGARCPKCHHMLKDSIIHFGENLPEVALEKAFQHANEADLCLVLGSSLTVSPANDVPKIVGKKKSAKLIIVNLQETPLDKLAAVRIWAKTDDFVERLSKVLTPMSPLYTPQDPTPRFPLGIDESGDTEELQNSTVATIPKTSMARQTRSERAPEHSMAEVPRQAPQIPTGEPLSILVGNRHEICAPVEPSDSCTHIWTMFVRQIEVSSRQSIQKRIASVTYRLHPTFTPCSVTVTSPSEDFSLTRRGWGEFQVAVVVNFDDGTTFSCSHMLSFSAPETSKRLVAA